MAIFDRSYDRDYGYRGGAYGATGSDRGLGDRMRHGWNRVKEGARDMVDRDDDRDYGHRGGAYGASGYGRDYDTSRYGNYGYGAGGGNRQRPGLNRLQGDDREVYDRDSSWYAGRGMGMGMGGAGAWNYDRDYDRGNAFSGSDRDTGYDRDHKSRWQTDQGDPFGDRANRTPIRMMRGEFRNYDAELRDRGSYDADLGRGYGAGSRMDYDRDMMGRGGMDRDRGRGYMHGLGYDPYDSDDARVNRGRWGAGNRDRGYDRGWF